MNPLTLGLSFLSALLSFVFFSPGTVLLLIIVLGQAHFIITYLYQYKAGKITPRYVLLYIGAALVLFLYVAPGAPYNDIIVATGIIFLWHFYLDELRISQLAVTPSRAFMGVALASSYGGVLATSLHLLPALATCMVCATLLMVAGGVQVWSKNIVGQDVSLFFLGVGAVLLMLGEGVRVWSVPPQYSLGFIILAHYVRWYLYYGIKFFPQKSVWKAYIVNATLIQAGVVLLYLLYANNFLGSARVLSPFFFIISFYMWTLLHIFFSYRKSDYAFLGALIKRS